MGDLGIALASSPLEDGHWISDEITRIIEVIRDLDPNIEVCWIPPENRAPGDAAFLFIEHTPDGRKHKMFYVMTEADFTVRNTLTRILEGDNARSPLTIAALDKHNDAMKLVQLKQHQDELEAKHDLAHHILKSPKSTYRHGGIVYE